MQQKKLSNVVETLELGRMLVDGSSRINMVKPRRSQPIQSTGCNVLK